MVKRAKVYYPTDVSLQNKDKYVAINVNGKTLVIDKNIASIIEQLNKNGMNTLHCCQGLDFLDENIEEHAVNAYIVFDRAIKKIPQLDKFLKCHRDIFEIVKNYPDAVYSQTHYHLINGEEKINLMAQTQCNRQFLSLFNDFLLNYDLTKPKRKFKLISLLFK